LRERKQALGQQLGVLAEQQMRLATRNLEEQALEITRQLSALTTEYEQIEAQIKTTNPHYAALTQPQPLSLQEVQKQVLDPQSTLLEYSLGAERSYIWAITPTSINSFELPPREDRDLSSQSVCSTNRAQSTHQVRNS
jgi:hypothetical protein